MVKSRRITSDLQSNGNTCPNNLQVVPTSDLGETFMSVLRAIRRFAASDHLKLTLAHEGLLLRIAPLRPKVDPKVRPKVGEN
jgi:hypothetical protein